MADGVLDFSGDGELSGDGEPAFEPGGDGWAPPDSSEFLSSDEAWVPPDDVGLVAEVADTMSVFAAQRFRRVAALRRNALDDAIQLLAACPDIKLLLNATHFSPSGRRFGTYYGYER